MNWASAKPEIGKQKNNIILEATLILRVHHFRSGQVFIVANYDPPGNFIGSFAENVMPITSQTPTPRIVINGISEDSIDSLLTDSSREDSDLDRFVNAILRYHNEYRKKHGAPELK